MSQALSFEKWQGLGNDFVIVEASPAAVEQAFVRRICDRRFGVGADGVLVVSRDENGKPRMAVFNADGSRPEMCGNGLRCVAGYLTARGAYRAELVVDTDAGERRCLVERIDAATVSVTVEMGVARSGPALLVDLDPTTHAFATIDMGNPHAITFEPYTEAEIDRVGPAVATRPLAGTNVEFCRVDATASAPRIEVVVWERGVGRTLACGTGACAVAALACDRGLAEWGEPVTVALPGGELTLRVEAGTRVVTMSGPAQCVFRGDFAPVEAGSVV